MKPYLPPDKRAQQIVLKIETYLPPDMPNRKKHALLIAKMHIKNTKIVLQFSAASLKDQVYWEVVEQQLFILKNNYNAKQKRNNG